VLGGLSAEEAISSYWKPELTTYTNRQLI